SVVSPLGSVAFATRRQRWALAGFYDVTTRFRHEFKTAEANLLASFVQGNGIVENGSGAAFVSSSATRLGGSIAVAPHATLSLGASVYVARFSYLADARVFV